MAAAIVADPIERWTATRGPLVAGFVKGGVTRGSIEWCVVESEGVLYPATLFRAFEDGRRTIQDWLRWYNGRPARTLEDRGPTGHRSRCIGGLEFLNSGECYSRWRDLRQGVSNDSRNDSYRWQKKKFHWLRHWRVGDKTAAAEPAQERGNLLNQAEKKVIVWEYRWRHR